MNEELQDKNFELIKKININEETIESLENSKFALESKELQAPDPDEFVKMDTYRTQVQLSEARIGEIIAL